MKAFKAKKTSKKNRKKVRLFLFTFFFFFAYMFMVKYLKDNQLKNTILQEDVNYIDFNMKKEIVKKVDKIINNPVSLLNENVKSVSSEKSETKADVKQVNQTKNTEEKTSVDLNNPIIYVYNTHQTEAYDNYSIYDAAKVLTDKLNNSGFSTYLEEQSIKTFLDTNNLKYYKSYVASRKYLDEARGKYPNITYFFDIHRDSVSKKISTLTYGGKNYAKVLFVVGTDNPGNQNNKKNAEKLNEIIKSKVPGISRGLALHGGKGYNGVYNQDVSENVFLIEVGGKDNTKEEVLNTINVIHESIIEYVRGIIWLVIKKYFMVLFGFCFSLF